MGAALVLALPGERPRQFADPRRRVAEPAEVAERARLHVEGEALVRGREGRRALVGPRGVGLPVVVARERPRAAPGVDDDARVTSDLVEARAELCPAVVGEARHLGQLAVAGVPDRPCALEQPDPPSADAAEYADPLVQLRVELGAAAKLVARAAVVEVEPRRRARRAVRARRITGDGVDGAGDRVGPEADGAGSADDVEAVDRPHIDREEVLVRPLPVEAVVHPDAVEEQQHLLPCPPADEGARLALRALLDENARLVAQRVGRGAWQPELKLLSRDARRGAPRCERSATLGAGAEPRCPRVRGRAGHEERVADGALRGVARGRRRRVGRRAREQREGRDEGEGQAERVVRTGRV